MGLFEDTANKISDRAIELLEMGEITNNSKRVTNEWIAARELDGEDIIGEAERLAHLAMVQIMRGGRPRESIGMVCMMAMHVGYEAAVTVERRGVIDDG